MGHIRNKYDDDMISAMVTYQQKLLLDNSNKKNFYKSRSRFHSLKWNIFLHIVTGLLLIIPGTINSFFNLGCNKFSRFIFGVIGYTYNPYTISTKQFIAEFIFDLIVNSLVCTVCAPIIEELTKIVMHKIEYSTCDTDKKYYQNLKILNSGSAFAFHQKIFGIIGLTFVFVILAHMIWVPLVVEWILHGIKYSHIFVAIIPFGTLMMSAWLALHMASIHMGVTYSNPTYTIEERYVLAVKRHSMYNSFTVVADMPYKLILCLVVPIGLKYGRPEVKFLMWCIVHEMNRSFSPTTKVFFFREHTNILIMQLFMKSMDDTWFSVSTNNPAECVPFVLIYVAWYKLAGYCLVNKAVDKVNNSLSHELDILELLLKIDLVLENKLDQIRVQHQQEVLTYIGDSILGKTQHNLIRKNSA